MSLSPAPIDALRAMYRSVRDGAELDAPRYVSALLAYEADTGEAWRIRREFEAFGYLTSLSALRGSAGAGARVRDAKARAGWRGAIRVASSMGMNEIWSAAMTAYYGPSGVHGAYLDADDVPTPETLVQFPRIATAMTEAAEKFERYCDYRDKGNEHKHYEDQVVSYAAFMDTRKRGPVAA